MSTNDSKTSWGKVADWYDQSVSREGSYQKDLILPNLLRLLRIKKGEKILDVACGQGFFAQEFFKKGAQVIGVDIAKELIALAQKKSPREIQYFVSHADRMPFAESASIDKAIVVLALQNIENVKKAFQECARVLKKNGKLFVVLNHPAFRVPQNSSWGWDAAATIKAGMKGAQYRRIDRYLSELKIPIQMRPGSTSSPQGGQFTLSFHRPLQYYFKALASAGFCVSRLEEWESRKKSQSGLRAIAEDIARKEFPLFLYLEALKIYR